MRPWMAIGMVVALAISMSYRAGAVQNIVVDHQTGLAISGFDPVAYFTESAPKFGQPNFELWYAGVIWRFRNEGNRAEFSEHPDVYMPRFGGYDPVGIARGVSVPGHPEIWLVAGQRLYLFYNEPARSAFAAQPERFIEAAERKWPAVQRTIAP
ncbi:MAG: YHS domain-containing (seleno)protein [Pseudolabrys sp.]|jgi:YHS domain-containing protein